MFQRKDVIVRASFVDIDNDDIYDLLSDVDGPTSVEKRHNPDLNGPKLILKGLTEIECASTTDLWLVFSQSTLVNTVPVISVSLSQTMNMYKNSHRAEISDNRN